MTCVLAALKAIHDVLDLPEAAHTDANASLCDDVLAARAIEVTTFIERVTGRKGNGETAARFRARVIRDYPLILTDGEAVS